MDGVWSTEDVGMVNAMGGYYRMETTDLLSFAPENSLHLSCSEQPGGGQS